MGLMRIVYVLNSGDPGGVEQHVLDLVRGMVARDHQVYVVCPQGRMAAEYLEVGAEVWIDQPVFDIDPFYIFRLRSLLKKFQPEIFHAHQLKTVVNGLIAAKLASVPATIAHIHTPLSEWQVPDWKKRLNIFINRLVCSWGADVVLALTKATKAERVRGEGIAPEKIVVIPNGVDLSLCVTGDADCGLGFRESLGVLEDVVLVGTLSRLTVEKGVGALIAAVSELAAYRLPHNAYRVVVAGDGPLRGALEQQAKDMGVADKIIFLGFLPEEEKLAYLSALDIFVFPSVAEGFGIALIEAMAAGCCCLTSNLPVLAEVGGKAVVVFRTSAAEDLAKHLAGLISDAGRRDALGESARARVEKEFTLEKFWERYEQLYENLNAVSR